MTGTEDEILSNKAVRQHFPNQQSFGLMVFSREFSVPKMQMLTRERRAAQYYSQLVQSVKPMAGTVTLREEKLSTGQLAYRVTVDDMADRIDLYNHFAMLYPEGVTFELLGGDEGAGAFLGGVFLACVPALSLLASAVILKKKPTRRQVVGISITFLGVMTTVIAVGISSSLSPAGYAALTLAVAAYALYSVFVDLASDYTGAEITYAMLLSGAAFYGLLALGEAAAHGTLTALLTLPVKNGAFRTAVLYQGVGCSVAAFFLSNAAIAKIGVNKTSSFIGVSTIVSILAGALALGEPLHVGQIVGAAVIVAGVYTANRA